jgi:hypothetical protein
LENLVAGTTLKKEHFCSLKLIMQIAGKCCHSMEVNHEIVFILLLHNTNLLFINKFLLNIVFSYDTILHGGGKMQNKSTKILSGLLMITLIFILAVDVVMLFTSPIWLNTLYGSGPVDVTRGGENISILMPTGTHTFMLIFVILSGLVLGAILLESIRLLRNIRKENPFSMANAKALRHSAWFSIAQMALFIAKMVNGPTVLTLGCAGIFLLAAMLYFVLADLFRSAALLREDNDLTI